jgi:Tfp pilus assembly protein PilF
MANRDERSGPATVPSARRSRPASTTRPTGTPARDGARTGRRVFGANLPIDVHRLIAAIALVGLLLVTLLTPLSYTAPRAAGFFTPQIDGRGSVGPGFTSRDVESSVFPYITAVERQQGNLSSTWPDASAVLNSDPNSREARRAIVGQMFASTGGINTRVKDSGLATRPDQEVFDAIVLAYQDMSDDPDRGNFGTNGLSMISALVSLTSPTLEQRRAREREAVVGFQTAASNDATIWQFTYNWALSNFMIGNYTAAYEGMKSVRARGETDAFKLVDFWMGLSALRSGHPDEAVTLFQSVIDYQVPADADEGARTSQVEARDLAQEALGDAQWARRDPATAYQTYKDTLFFGRATAGLYRKWLRLGLQQHGYERMVDDLAAVIRSGPQDMRPRAHHDRARLLDLLGRGSEAQVEYARALELGSEDAPLHISYGQSLVSKGDYNGALVQAETALRGLNRDLQGSDLALAARAVLTTTSSTAETETGQAALDAQLLRARAWGAQGNRQNVDTLVNNITGPAGGEGADTAALLYLYGGYAYEAAASASSGDAAGELYAKAAEQYARAWAGMKGRPQGSPGKAAALAGQARATAMSAGKGPEDGLAVLREGGYDPAAIPAAVSRDVDAPDILYQGGLLLEQAGRQQEAVNAYRVSGVVRNLVDAEDFVGVGRVLWANNGTTPPANAALETGDAARVQAANGGDSGLAVMRYKQAYSLDPALAPAWNNLGVWYAEQGKADASASYLELSGRASPYYALGNHNLAGLAYKKGIGNFFVAEGAQGNAIKAAGAPSLNWGYNLRYDARGSVPAPPGPPLDFLVRLGAIVLVALLLLHTFVGHDRQTRGGELLPVRGVLGRAAAAVDGAVKRTVPAAVTPGSGARSLVIAVLVPAVIGTLGLAWGAGRGSLEVALVFVPVALLWAALAFAANEIAQRWMAARSKGETLHHLWPLGNLLSILTIPFGFMYGWQNVTRIQPVTEAGAQGARRGRTSDESELAYEAVVEAAADVGGASERSLPAAGAPVRGSGRLGLTPASRIMFAGMVANLALGVVFGLAYWLTGWPSMRLGLFATMLVLAFTSVSEPPADGWTLYRRNAPLWLAVFVLSSTVAVLLALSAI